MTPSDRPTRTRTVKVEMLARVEGEGGLFLTIRDGEVIDAKLKIFEPPRFFEGLLRGRDFREAPDITARICGICPVAYQMSAVHAMEAACGVAIPDPIRQLRRLLYCGEWIESHALHVYLLHAPDFLGYQGVVDLARDHPALVQRGLQLKKVGNEILQLLGGREIHPINVRVGGFYRVPRRSELRELRGRVEWALEAAIETTHWVSTFNFPEFARPYHFVALHHPDEYPMNVGRVISSSGLDLAAEEYADFFEEVHVEHSTALHGRLRDGSGYLVGPLARFNLNFDQLSPRARELAGEVGLAPNCTNPFRSIVVRSIELIHACEEALRLIDGYAPPADPAVEVLPRAGMGHAWTEAPRGMLYHRYLLAEDGRILDAQIVPPTSQNQPSIEFDLREFAQRHLHLSDGELTWRCEQATRNYDPCISCSTHFLKLHKQVLDPA